MITALAIIAGACYSASYVAPDPFWVVCLFLSTVCVFMMRFLQ